MQIHQRAAVAAVLTAAALLGLGTRSHAQTWRIEAEQAGEGNVEKSLAGEYVNPSWKVEKAADASGGAFLGGAADAESHAIPTVIPHAGMYRIWVRHYHIPGKFTSINTLFRDDIGGGAGFGYVDYKPRVQTAKLPEPVPATPKDAQPAFVWSSFDLAFERPMAASVSFAPGCGVYDGRLGIDCVVISDDMTFNPATGDWKGLPTDPGPLKAAEPPHGMKPAPVFDVNSAFFGGDSQEGRKFTLALCNAWLMYRDSPWLVQLGANHDHGWQNGSAKYGIGTEVAPDGGKAGQMVIVELERKIPAPTGRFVSAQGTIGGFSLYYEPYRKAILEALGKTLPNYLAADDTENFMLNGEGGGNFDYSDTARDAFHHWLADKFGPVDKLNAAWLTHYKSYDEVVLPRTPKPAENKAAYFAFREFSGLGTAIQLGEKAQYLREHDPKHRPSASQSSCLSINSPYFTAMTPLDYEDLVNVSFAHEPEFGMDSYSTEDCFCGCDMALTLSLTGDRRMLNNEFNVHSQDPREMARTYWGQIGMGVKGICTWCFQPTPQMWMYQMWGLLNADCTPRDKLGPIADANHEIHHLERILGPAKTAPLVKPVALYYSRMDLSLPQTTLGIYSGALDSPYRVYGLLRSLGYPVRWITPRQIQAGQLKDVGAVILVGVRYVPGDAAKTLAQWVKDGGSLIGDQWPGAFDEFDRQQTTLFDTFGIRPIIPAKPADKAKAQADLEKTTTPVGGGIDPEILRTLSVDELFQGVEEMWDQWDSQHPVAKAVGNFHFSGFDMRKVQVVSGEILAMGMSGGAEGLPAITTNTPGKGHTLYFGSMLGSLYEAGPVAFEWDSTREGPGLYHLLDAYLKFSGVEPFAQTGLPERQSWKTHIELPQVDAKGNFFIGLTSLNDAALPAFPLTLRWPATAPRPKLLMACVGGSRRLIPVPFTIKDGRMSLTMPGFDTSASLVGLVDTDPLISLEFEGAPRGIAGLLDVTPGTRLKIKATVWNPSPRKLPKGELKLFAAPGWFCKDGEKSVKSIDPFEMRELSLELAPPALCARRMLRPIVAKYQSGQVTSTPATEMVWWEPPTH